MTFQEQVVPAPSNNDTSTIGCLHGLSTFAKLYTFIVLDNCFSVPDLSAVVVRALCDTMHFGSFDRFQVDIFKSLVLFECLLLVLLIFLWGKYSGDINERLQSTDTVVDEGEDVSQLNFPKSYTPRI